jgi:hypothetical protein
MITTTNRLRAAVHRYLPDRTRSEIQNMLQEMSFHLALGQTKEAMEFMRRLCEIFAPQTSEDSP